MTKSTTSERLRQIMSERGLKQVDVLELAKPYCEKYNTPLSKTAISQYVSGKFVPRQDKLTILGMALNVSEVWLMGFDVPRDRKATPTTDTVGDGQMEEFIDLFGRLSGERKDLVINVIKGLLAEQ